MRPLRTTIAAVRKRLAAIHAVERSVVRACLTAGGTGVFILAAVALHKSPTDRREMLFTVAEHGASALIVAAFMGITYELYMLRVRAKHQKLQDDARFDRLAPLLPETVFGLLGDVASRSMVMPTLFKPFRSDQEALFVKDPAVFKKLLGAAADRDKDHALLRGWICGDNLKLRFLASDIVGFCGVEALRDDLNVMAEKGLAEWDRLSAEDRDWVLNYKWAASSFEHPRYSSLASLLITRPEEEIHRWILFVPRQMACGEFSEMIRQYLRKRREAITIPARESVLHAMVALHEVRSQRRTFRKYSRLFELPELAETYAQAKAVIERRTGDDRRRTSRATPDRRSS